MSKASVVLLSVSDFSFGRLSRMHLDLPVRRKMWPAAGLIGGPQCGLELMQHAPASRTAPGRGFFCFFRYIGPGFTARRRSLCHYIFPCNTVSCDIALQSSIFKDIISQHRAIEHYSSKLHRPHWQSS
ncbi:uncharacterized protein K489DRAFT_165241 [Dissoconium aciculare CBS 342.82]|uniref:Uncharacterized protein n=1 Tax=Dissoconium aciculare CBS 342.82 TaxID=1314786 RepID=A0A6J3MCE6_9PEZI|nr:uncharacterized protein K489DRAFT_165241 [Dissoconium aciculare CBS 342.82]KAF1825695.1 hypothetical protein K489DRAFT_165241 [Dissoconium aciculare CBS 342.82]